MVVEIKQPRTDDSTCQDSISISVGGTQVKTTNIVNIRRQRDFDDDAPTCTASGSTKLTQQCMCGTTLCAAGNWCYKSDDDNTLDCEDKWDPGAQEEILNQFGDVVVYDSSNQRVTDTIGQFEDTYTKIIVNKEYQFTIRKVSSFNGEIKYGNNNLIDISSGLIGFKRKFTSSGLKTIEINVIDKSGTELGPIKYQFYVANEDDNKCGPATSGAHQRKEGVCKPECLYQNIISPNEISVSDNRCDTNSQNKYCCIN